MKNGARDESDYHLGLLEVYESFDIIELWFGPDPRAQINLAKLLWYIRDAGCGIDKFLLARVDFAIGEHWPSEVVALRPEREHLTQDQLLAGSLLWDAFVWPTPEALFKLLTRGFSALPYARSTILRLLKELPSIETGLGLAETKLLESVARPAATWVSVAEGYSSRGGRPTIDWCEAELLLSNLASCAVPAIVGFSIDPFRDPPDGTSGFDKDLFHAHRTSPLSLTPLGRDLVGRKDDFAKHNSINRWIGGTRLDTAHLWRWDSRQCRLIQPG